MTIHHDKLAYGKLAKTNEEMSDEDILKMLKSLEDDEEEKEDKKEDASK
ncbi:MAG: hypothetical protein K2K80_01805 [Clostridia bacterium]|nr:hypothetical protein [Clostridia bacterium]